MELLSPGSALYLLISLSQSLCEVVLPLLQFSNHIITMTLINYQYYSDSSQMALTYASLQLQLLISCFLLHRYPKTSQIQNI